MNKPCARPGPGGKLSPKSLQHETSHTSQIKQRQCPILVGVEESEHPTRQGVTGELSPKSQYSALSFFLFPGHVRGVVIWGCLARGCCPESSLLLLVLASDTL